MSNKYWASSITGGVSGSLDSIDPTDTDGSSTVLVANDICTVDESNMFSTYILRDSAGAVESDPDVIIPDNNPSDFWWELIERVPQDEGMVTSILYNNIPGGF